MLFLSRCVLFNMYCSGFELALNLLTFAIQSLLSHKYMINKTVPLKLLSI